jgi:hypothetical protein
MDCAEWQGNRVFGNVGVCMNMPAYTASPQSAGTSVGTLNIEYLYLYHSYLNQEIISQFNTCANKVHFSVI